MKYKWWVDYVYDGEMDSLIGKHTVKIKFKPIDFYSEEVENFFSKKRRRVGAYFKLDKDKYLIHYIKKVNYLMIQDLKKDSDDEKIVREVMRLLPLIKQDTKLRQKRELIKEIENRKGSGEI